MNFLNQNTFIKDRSDRIDRSDILAMILLLVFWCVFLRKSPAALHQALVDNAYIFQRVVDNVWDGRGWTYNTDVQVNPITSPFYALVLLGGKFFALPAQFTIGGIYCSALILLGIGIYLGMRQYGRLLAWTMAVTVSSGSIFVSSWGMETSTFMACIVWATLVFTRKHYRMAGLLCAFASLSRPEGMAMIGILTGVHLLKDRKIPWGMIAVFCVALTPWLLFTWFTYGYILPNSVSVKAIQADMAWLRPLGHWSMYFLTQPKMPWITYPLALFGGFYAWREYVGGKPFMLVVMVFGILQVIAYSMMHAPIGYFWYLAPGNLTIDMAVVFGLYKILKAILSCMQVNAGVNINEHFRVLLVFLLTFFGTFKFASTPYTLLKPYRLGDDYTKAGVWINQNTPKDTVVAATEIGYIGYFSNRKIRDIHGLIHPESLPFLKKEAWEWWYKTNPPQIIVMHKPAWPGEPALDSGWNLETLRDFEDRYRMVRNFGTIEIYQRRVDADR